MSEALWWFMDLFAPSHCWATTTTTTTTNSVTTSSTMDPKLISTQPPHPEVMARRRPPDMRKLMKSLSTAPELDETTLCSIDLIHKVVVGWDYQTEDASIQRILIFDGGTGDWAKYIYPWHRGRLSYEANKSRKALGRTEATIVSVSSLHAGERNNLLSFSFEDLAYRDVREALSRASQDGFNAIYIANMDYRVVDHSLFMKECFKLLLDDGVIYIDGIGFKSGNDSSPAAKNGEMNISLGNTHFVTALKAMGGISHLCHSRDVILGREVEPAVTKLTSAFASRVSQQLAAKCS